jgi:hypothetical protein
VSVLRAILLSALLLVPLASCDPCSGIIGCSNGRYLAAAGQIVDAVTGVGIDGARIDLVRVGGIETEQDSVSAVTANGGFWRAELSPHGAGTVVADINVATPGHDPYRLRNVELQTREHAGDANLNERWIPFLYFDFVAEFFIEGTADVRPEGVLVDFRRRSGLPLTGPGQVAGVYTAPTNSAGRIHLYPTTGDSAVFGLADGTLTGDLIVHLTPTDSTVIAGVLIWPSHTFRDRREAAPIIRAAVGP